MSNAVIIRNRFFGALIFACLYSCVTTAIQVSLEEANMQIDGKPLVRLEAKACKKKDKQVNILVNDELWKTHQGLRIYQIPAPDEKQNCSKNNKPPAKGDPSLTEITRTAHTINQEVLLSNPNACPTNNEGGYGHRLLCIYPLANFGEKADEPIAQIKYYVDTRIAQIEGFTTPVAANGEINFTVKIKGGAAPKMWVCYGPNASNIKNECPETAGWKKDKQATPNAYISDLDKQQTYNVKVMLADTYKDEKWVEVPGDLKPIPINGPLETYDGEGGVLTYGCSASPNAADCLLVAFIAALFIGIRNRSRLLALKKPLLMLPLLFLAPAQESRAELGTVSAGILGSMYRPNLDSETGANDFYKCHFRKDTSKEDGPINPLMGFDINWHLWDGLRLGFGVGYTYVPGVGLETENNLSLCNKPREGYAVSMHMYQIRPQLSYELDHFVEYFPLFPYVRGALIGQGYHFFNGETGPKEKTNSQGKIIKNSGFSFGWQAALGLKLRLDFLEPGAVRSAYSAEFFDHVYLMSELSYEKINNFGKAGFDFSPKDIMGTKLPLMWTFGLVFDLL